MDREEEEEALFEYKTPSVISNTTPPPSYYVQSPSTISNENSFEFHPNSNPIQIFCLSPRQIENGNIRKTISSSPEASRRFTFYSSPCSSTRESLTHLFVDVHEKSVPYGRDNDNAHHGFRVKSEIVDREGNHGKSRVEKEEGYGGNGGWRKYMSFRTYDGSMWICLQLSWRFMVSLFAALLVFYIATKPPSPSVSIKFSSVGDIAWVNSIFFVVKSGVLTKIMNCNTTVEVDIDNQSKVFALYLHPPSLQISFQGFTFASSQGEKLIAESQQVTRLKLYVGTRSKPMYGAGSMMQDVLNSSPGLPLRITVNLVSKYRIVGRFLRSRFHHRAQCLVVLVRGYDAKHRTHRFNATCTVLTS